MWGDLSVCKPWWPALDPARASWQGLAPRKPFWPVLDPTRASWWGDPPLQTLQARPCPSVLAGDHPLTRSGDVSSGRIDAERERRSLSQRIYSPLQGIWVLSLSLYSSMAPTTLLFTLWTSMAPAVLLLTLRIPSILCQWLHHLLGVFLQFVLMIL